MLNAADFTLQQQHSVAYNNKLQQNSSVEAPCYVWVLSQCDNSTIHCTRKANRFEIAPFESNSACSFGYCSSSSIHFMQMRIYLHGSLYEFGESQYIIIHSTQLFENKKKRTISSSQNLKQIAVSSTHFLPFCHINIKNELNFCLFPFIQMNLYCKFHRLH